MEWQATLVGLQSNIAYFDNKNNKLPYGRIAKWLENVIKKTASRVWAPVGVNIRMNNESVGSRVLDVQYGFQYVFIHLH